MHYDVKCLFDDEFMRISLAGSADADLSFVCFSGIGEKFGGMQKEEFALTLAATRGRCVFIADKHRSWMNNIDISTISDVFGKLGIRRIVAIGNSMGGFGAIWMASFIQVEKVIAFVPQYSVYPGLVPWENRFREYVSRISKWHVPSLDHKFLDSVHYSIIWGEQDEHDRQHRLLFPIGKNFRSIRCEGVGHDVAASLKKAGILGSFLRALIHGQPVTPILESVGLQSHDTQA